MMIRRHSLPPPPPAAAAAAAAASLTHLLHLLLFFFLRTSAHPCQSATCKLPPTAYDPSPSFSVSYPFGTALGCGASPAFLLLNCSSSSPSPVLWTGFQPNATLAPPYVTGIWKPPDSSSGNDRSYVNLTWMPPQSEGEDNLSLDVCDPPSFTDDFAPFFPSNSPPISLDDLGFAGAITFSDNTHFLLLNCASPNFPFNPNDLQLLGLNSSFCRTYARLCNYRSGTAADPLFAPTQCIELQLNTTRTINFTDLISTTLDPYKCTHFQLLVQKDLEVNGTAGMLQLTWLDDQLLLPPHDLCKTCETTQGTCGYDTADTSRLLCVCSEGNSTSAVFGCKDLTSGWKAKGCGTGCKIGVAVGVVMVFLALLLFFGCQRYRLLRKRRGVNSRGIPLTVPVSASSNSSNKLFTERARSLSTKFGPVHVKEFSYEDLVKATDSFAESNMIGDGGFGAVYLGVLSDGRWVAVKRLYHDHFRRMDQFYNEMKILSSFSHPNLVKLYGFCCQDDKDLLLVFEYAAKGTVWDHLHGGRDGGSIDAGGMNGRLNSAPPKLPWPIRLRIACETAEALSYLHNDVKPPIYHRDVKTCNILLDDWMHVKMADFGLSRLVPMNVTHVTTAPQGTPGYVDPDYHKCYQLTDKSDVYSFGVVLAELVSGQLAVDMERQRGEINLSSLALSKIGSGRWKDLVDPALLATEDDTGKTEEMVKAVLELAFTCLQEEKEDRPTMKQVSEILAEIGSRGGCDYKSTAVILEEVDEMKKLIGNGGADSTDAPSHLSSDVHSPASSLFGNW